MNTSPRILIVDDSPTVRLYYQKSLEAVGYLVDEAVNGVEALERALSAHYDLILVDVNMPKMDGVEFVRQVRSPPNGLTTPIIMITNESETKDRRTAYQSGVSMFLTKPIKANELAKIARFAIGRFR